MYAFIHVEPRYLGGWLVLLFVGAVCACTIAADQGTQRAVLCISVAALLTAGLVLVLQVSREAVGIDHAVGRSPHDVAIASALVSAGLRPGDRVALIGDGSVAFWAHLAQLRLVAEIPARSASGPSHPALDLWESAPEQQQNALKILEGTGAKALVAGSQQSIFGAAPSIVPPPWKRIGGTDAYVYFFFRTPPAIGRQAAWESQNRTYLGTADSFPLDDAFLATNRISKSFVFQRQQRSTR